MNLAIFVSIICGIASISAFATAYIRVKSERAERERRYRHEQVAQQAKQAEKHQATHTA
jgi:hypothetical protein